MTRREPRTTVAFRTLGCRLNQCETAQMEESLAEKGFAVVPWKDRADVRVLNTCTVTAKTDRACRNEIGRVGRTDPDGILIVTGCYAQVAADRIARIPGVDLVLGNLDKGALPEHVDRLLARPVTPDGLGSAETRVTDYAPDTAFSGDFVTHFSGYTRAFLKVQNGCDARCAYCIIPLARGPSRSMPLHAVLEQVRLLHEQGYREVVLTGIHLGCWGRDTSDGDLARLLDALAAETAMDRFRLSSIEPLEVDDAVLDAMRRWGDRFAHHFHLPLQSGSDAVLSRMRRPYDAAVYAERVHAVRAAFPDAAIGADVIVGFPGETDAEFEETVDLVADLPLTYLHVFPYSDREGTEASSARGKVRADVIAERSTRLRALGDEKDARFQASFAGRTARALLLKQRAEDATIVGLTGNYLEVAVPGTDGDMNRFARVTLTTRRPDGRWSATIEALEEPRIP